MKIIRLKIKPEVKEMLSEVSAQFRTGDRGFVEDIYSLLRLRGNGLPSKARAEKLADYAAKQAGMSILNARIITNKRVHVLSQMVGTAYFKALATLPDPIDAVRRLLLNFQQLYLKYREAQCRTCQFLTQCDFGKQYQHATTDIRRVIDPDFQKKAHPQCPVLPQIALTYQISESMATLKRITQLGAEANAAGTNVDDIKEAEEDAADGLSEVDCDDELAEDSLDMQLESNLIFHDSTATGAEQKGEHGTRYQGGHTGQYYCQQFETMVNKLTPTQLVIFEIGQKFGLSLTRQKKGKFHPTEEMSQDRTPEKIENLGDIPKLVSSEHGLPETVFEHRLQKKSLQKKQNMKSIQKRKLLYLLIDNSGSMGQLLSGNAYCALSRGMLAEVFAMSLTRRVRDDGGMVFCRFFAETPGVRMNAKTKDEFEPMLKMMAHADFNGGSTNIVAAAKAAVQDIKNSKDEVAKSEVILITDCQDSFNAAEILKALNGIEMNTLDISGTSGKTLQYEGSVALQAASKKYYKVNPQSLSIDKIVEIV